MNESTVKICIFDDEEDIRAVLRFELAELNAEIIEWDLKEPPLEFIQRTDPNLIICDIRMPGINGFEIHELIRSNGIDTNVIFISGDTYLKKEHSLYNDSSVTFVMKPWEFETILNLAKKALNI